MHACGPPLPPPSACASPPPPPRACSLPPPPTQRKCCLKLLPSMPSFYHYTRSVCPPGAGLMVPACAYLSSEDSIRGAAASLVGSEVPASIESGAALDRDGRVARRKRSTLQVVRVTCLAARVGRDAAALALGGRRESIAVKVPARLSARRIWGCLILFFSAVAGGGVWLGFFFFCSFRLPDAWSVAFFSFLTSSVDAPG
jgi:hypothetical protein